jgi:hypothetical protein
MLAWIRERRLIAHAPVVQLSIRLLIPPNSALLDVCEPGTLGSLDPANFAYAWRHPDPRMDELQARVTLIAAGEAAGDAQAAFAAVEALAYSLAGWASPHPPREAPARLRPTPPRLTEDWFC